VSVVFPRYHQLDVTRRLQAAVLAEGTGGKYLVQHSAGSGKTNSIANVKLRGRFDHPASGEYDPRRIFAHSFGVFISGDAPVERLELRLSERWRHYVKTHDWHSSQRHEIGKDGSVSMWLELRICPDVKNWIYGFGNEAAVLAPAWFRSEVAKTLRSGAAPYRASSLGAAGPGVAKPRAQVAVSGRGNASKPTARGGRTR